jgi:t-SNARE complex subunit (syntaxin)
MRKNIVLTLVRRFKEHLVAFQKEQTAFAEDARGRAVRQLQVAMPNATAEEAAKLVAEGATAADAISKKMQVTAQVEDQAAAHMTVIKHLYGLQDRMNDLRKMEQSIAGLHQMFVEMAALVDKQGEMLDHIEVSVTNTKNYTRDAEKALITARQKQHKSEKRTMMLCCCCTILLSVILLPMWISGKLR